MRRKILHLSADHLLADQLRLIYGNVGISVVPAVFLALLLVYTLHNDGNRWYLLLWCAAVMATKLISAVDARRRLAAQDAAHNAGFRVLQSVILHAADGAAWGALAWVALDSTQVTSSSIMVWAVLTGILGSSMSLLAPVPIVFLAFSAALLAPAVAWLWSTGDAAYETLSLAGLLYVASLVGQARNSGAAALAAIKLRFENVNLIKAADAARSEAEHANLAKSKFLAAASHDLRQPVHAQGLFLGVLSRTALSAHQSEVLTSAQSAWQACSDMLNTLLDFSRIEAGVVRPNLGAVNLQHLLYKIENDLAPLADLKGLVYRSRETRLFVRSDPLLLEMIVRNLVSNAIRYTPRGGLLIACRRRGSSVSLEVWDTGIGVAAADQPDIFREFHQLGNPERDRNKGLGLGLAIAQGLGQALGPELTLSSRLGRGSVFRIQLPLVDKVTAPRASQPLGVLRKGLQVLVLDDDDAVRQGMAHLLQSWGCECDTAGSIDEALIAAAQRTPDVLISDYRLRGTHTGAEAVASLRALLGSDVPALIVTGDTAPERLREALASGILLLHKPLKPDQLHSALAGLDELAQPQEVATEAAIAHRELVASPL